MDKENRFERIYKQSGFSTGYEVIVDQKTGVNYLFVKEGYGAGLTPLLGRDGKLVITAVGSVEMD